MFAFKSWDISRLFFSHCSIPFDYIKPLEAGGVYDSDITKQITCFFFKLVILHYLKKYTWTALVSCVSISPCMFIKTM